MSFLDTPVAAPAARFRTWLFAGLTVLLALAFTLRFALARGQDWNWDRQNYHLLLPDLLTRGQYWDSVAPAGIQSYFNPLLLQAQFWAMAHLSALQAAILLALVQSGAFMLGGAICAILAPPSRDWHNFILAASGMMLGILSPIALSEAGTSFIDLLTALPVLAAYALLLRDPSRARTLAAGLLLGAATALKLTNGVFAVAALAFLLFPPRPRRTLPLLGAMAAGFLLLGGGWMAALWRRFGNPFFPYYNNLFHSPDYPATALHDGRFLPHTAWAIWRYPLYWFTGGNADPALPSPGSELGFHDVRWLLAVCGVTVFLAAFLVCARWRRARLADPASGLILAFAAAYLLWLDLFAIQRYLVALEILCGAVLLALARLLPRASLRLAAMPAVLVLAFATMSVPDWGHLPWRARWEIARQAHLPLREPALIFLTGKPMGFAALAFPPRTRFVGASGELDLRAERGNSLTRQIAAAVRVPGQTMAEVDRGELPGAAAAILSSYGLRAGTDCRRFTVADQAFRLCPLRGR